MVGQGRFANIDTGIGSEKMSKNDPGNKVEKAPPSKKNNEPNKKPEAANPHACILGHIRLFVTLWTVSCQDPLSVGVFRQEYWIGSLSPSPTQKIKPASSVSPALQADSSPLNHQGNLSKSSGWIKVGQVLDRE